MCVVLVIVTVFAILAISNSSITGEPWYLPTFKWPGGPAGPTTFPTSPTAPTIPTAPTAPTGPATFPTPPSPPPPGVPTATPIPTGPIGPTAPMTQLLFPIAPRGPPLTAAGPTPIVQPPGPAIPQAACGALCSSSIQCPGAMKCVSEQTYAKPWMTPWGITVPTNLPTRCVSPSCPENTPLTCNDKLDNDNDGVWDCGDTSCFGIGQCTREYGNHLPNNFAGFITSCRDGFDNDNDNLIDCSDPDCAWTCAENDAGNCRDGIDNDGDGFTDSTDAKCTNWWQENFAGGCLDWIDNDGDGLTDCKDTVDCGTHPLCAEGKSIGTTNSCFDRKDNDNDNLIDCADSDCINSGVCTEQGNCIDGIDNDGDGLIDCLDTIDCGTNPLCALCSETEQPLGDIFQYGTVTSPGAPGNVGVHNAADICLRGNILYETICPGNLYNWPVIRQTTCPGLCNNGQC